MKKSVFVSTYALIMCLMICPGVKAQNAHWMKQYELVRPSDEVFIVTKASKMAVVDRTGLPLTKLEYDTIYNFQEGIAVVGKGKKEVNQFGKVLSDFKYGYLNKSGQLIVDTRYESINAFSNGLGLIEIFGGRERYENRTGYIFINQVGQTIINRRPMYNCLPFQGGTAYVEVPRWGFWLPPYDDGRDNGQHTQLYDVDGENIYGNYLDRQGRLLIPWQYDTIAPYRPGYLRAVRKGGKWGFLDSLAILQSGLQYDDIDQDSSHFWKDKHRVGINRKFGFINAHNGKLIIPIQYEDSKPSYSDLVWVRLQQRWGCLNEAGRVVIPFHFSNAQSFDKRVAIVQQGKLWGTVNQVGKVLAPTKYDSIYAFQEDRAIFQLANKFGFIDLAGHEIIPARYSKVSSFKAGHAYATVYGLFVTLDPNGSWTSIKLQVGTLKAIVWVVVIALIISLFWWRRQRLAIRNSPV